jgi:hypothetical protein
MNARLATSSFGVLILLAIGCQNEQAIPTSPSSLPAVQTMTLSGVVLDTAANPVENASVEIFSGATAQVSASTDVAGRFSIVFDRVASQALSVRVTKSGFHPVTVNSLSSPQLQIRLLAVDLLNLRAAYSITIEASGCDGIPAHLRRRTYNVSIGSPQTYTAIFTGNLDGATFYRGYGTLWALVGNNTAKVMIYSWDAFERWLEDQPIFERLEPSGYLALMGAVSATPSDANGTLSGAFDGSFSYCPSSSLNSAHVEWPPTCNVTAVTCESPNHQVTLVPR